MMTRLPFRSLVVAIFSVAALRAPAAGAQILSDSRPTRGIEVPGGPIVGDADATALELNPGQLGFMGGGNLELVSDFWSSAAVRPGRGTGLFLGGHGFAFGYQWIRPTTASVDTYAPATLAPGQVPSEYGKLQVGYGAHLGRVLGVGVSYSHFFADSFKVVKGVDTWDAGLSIRPHRLFGLGLVVHDLARPTIFSADDGLQRVWEPELAVRPFGTDSLEGAVAARVGETRHDVGWRGRLTGRLFAGLRLFGELDSAPFETGAGDTVVDYRGTLGLWADLEHFGVGGAAFGGSNGGFGPSDARRTSGGGGFMLRLSGDVYQALPLQRRIERVDLADLDGDRKFLRLVVRLRRLAVDPSAAGVLFKIDDLDLGMGRIEELRDLIAGLRKAGKTVYAFLPSGGTREYYLASACDRIFAPPAGSLALTGLHASVTFYKRAMERLGIDVDLVRIAEYKGAMEPFVLTEQSGPVRQNRNELLDDHYRRLVAAVAEGRRAAGLTEARARALIDKGLFTSAEAKDAGLVDEVKAFADLEKIDDLAVRDTGMDGPRHPTAWTLPRVAVVLVGGAIVDGKSQDFPFDVDGTSGSETVVAALDKARKDSSVKAVVLRVNSGGGSASASDDIARAVKRVREAGKPVVVSMGDIAASGGYYVSAPGDVVFAEPGTTTGSIGIFTFHVDVHGLTDKLGIGVETYNRGAHADYFSPFRPWTDEERKMAADQIRHVYGMFLDAVADGRKAQGLDAKRVDEIGRGHVWTGAQAQGVKLVDRMGGIGAALDEAAVRAHLPTGAGGLPETIVLPRPPSMTLSAVLGASISDDDDDAPGDGGDDRAAAGSPLAPAEAARRLFAAAGRSVAHLVLPVLVTGGTGTMAMAPYDLQIR